MKCPICLLEMIYDPIQEEWICPGEVSIDDPKEKLPEYDE